MYLNVFGLIGLQIECRFVFSLEFIFVISEEIFDIARRPFSLPIWVPWQVLYYETHLSTKQVVPHLHQIDGCSLDMSTTGIQDVSLHQTGGTWRREVTVPTWEFDGANKSFASVNWNSACCMRKYHAVMTLHLVWTKRKYCIWLWKHCVSLIMAMWIYILNNRAIGMLVYK